MITFNIPVKLLDSNEATYPAGFNIVLDCLRRNDTSVVAIAYMRKSDAVVTTHETAYTAAEVDGETLTETDTSAMFAEAVYLLEKARLEALNPSATFTITL